MEELLNISLGILLEKGIDKLSDSLKNTKIEIEGKNEFKNYFGVSFDKKKTKEEVRIESLKQLPLLIEICITNKYQKRKYIKNISLIYENYVNDDLIILDKKEFKETTFYLNPNEYKYFKFKLNNHIDLFEEHNWMGKLYIELNTTEKIIKSTKLNLEEYKPNFIDMEFKISGGYYDEEKGAWRV